MSGHPKSAGRPWERYMLLILYFTQGEGTEGLASIVTPLFINRVLEYVSEYRSVSVEPNERINCSTFVFFISEYRSVL
jgi:hypothetical protein